jgi:hypothetical protein
MVLGKTLLPLNMAVIHHITSVRFEHNFLLIDADGKRLTCDLNKLSHRLLQANDEERNNYVISPSGYGIHWPALDEDISVHALLAK